MPRRKDHIKDLRDAIQAAKVIIADMRSKRQELDTDISEYDQLVASLTSTEPLGPAEQPTSKCRTCGNQYTGRKCPCKTAAPQTEPATGTADDDLPYGDRADVPDGDGVPA